MPKSKHADVNIGSYLSGIDLPPFDKHGDLEYISKLGNTYQIAKCSASHEKFRFHLGFSNKYAKKKEMKGPITMQATTISKQVVISDNYSAFTIAIGTQSFVDADANLKDIFIDRFFVSVQGKVLLKNASLKISQWFSMQGKEILRNASLKVSHGRGYGLVRPNEQEIVEDDPSPLEVVVFANKELIKLKKKATTLLDEIYDDHAEKLATIYEKLQLLGLYTTEAHAPKISVGLSNKYAKKKEKKGLIIMQAAAIAKQEVMKDDCSAFNVTNSTQSSVTTDANLKDISIDRFFVQGKEVLKNISLKIFHGRCYGLVGPNGKDIIHLHDEELYLYRGNFDAFKATYKQKMKKSKKTNEIYEKQLKTCNHNGCKKDTKTFIEAYGL
ncbi:hypothetical protein L7F22_026180 [Adiantum nelumboides]|nr:hypothetical protein [Adiantum nelumboides]